MVDRKKVAKLKVGLYIDPELWKRVRLKAVEINSSASAIVQDALHGWLVMVEDARSVELVVPLALPVKVTTAVPDDDRRCSCGQRWRDHQGGDSGRLAVVTNCRNWRPVA